MTGRIFRFVLMAMTIDEQFMRIPEVNEATFEAEVLRSRMPVLVAFGASWSKACGILKSVLTEIVEDCAGQARVVRVDVDDNPDLGLWYGIESIPTLLWFIGGKVHARIVGTASKAAILAKLKIPPAAS